MTRPRVWANLRVRAGDGCRLATDVFLPDPLPGPVPTVVTRTPYGRGRHLREGMGWARHGFAFVVQDVRGRYDSEGQWRPYQGEYEDGAACLAWLGEQVWSDGRYIPRGHSYGAYSAWAMASVGDPAAVISLCSAVGFDRVKFEPSGILRLAEHVAWWIDRADSRTDRVGLWEAMVAADPAVLDHLPVADLADRLWAELPGWAEVVLAGPGSCTPEPLRDEMLAACQAPTAHVGGWLDILAGEVLRLWDMAGSAVRPRPRRELLLGPWGHDLATGAGTPRGGFAPRSRLALGQWEVAWLRDVLSTEETRSRTDTPRGVYVMGAGRWLPVDRWPPTPARRLRWGTDRAGRLGPEPGPGGVDIFVYDPLDPFPSMPVGADRANLARRADAARYTSAPLVGALTIVGDPLVVLDGRTDAPTTDWIARLLRLDPDGRQIEISRGSIDTGAQASGPWRIPMAPLAVEVPAGTRLRLEITSSDFPYLARNLGTAGDRYRGTATRPARQQIRTGPDQTALLFDVLLGDPA